MNNKAKSTSKILWLALGFFLVAAVIAVALTFRKDNTTETTIPNTNSVNSASTQTQNQSSSTTESQNNSQSSNSASTSTPIPATTTGTKITTGTSEFGTMLFNDKNQAIYIWELEQSSTTECYGDCAEAWPPVLTDGAPQALGQVNASLLGTTKRSDGTTQVTYNSHPLYYYAHEGPGEVKCHNIRTHGGLWWVIGVDGIRLP